MLICSSAFPFLNGTLKHSLRGGPAEQKQSISESEMIPVIRI